MDECIFCKIVEKSLPAKIVCEDDRIIAFEDISPKAPLHVLIIPKKHISTLFDVEEKDNELIGHMVYVAKKIAQDKGYFEKGYRVVMNCKSDGGQLVFHIHLHLLAGRTFEWPPG
ncbi:MAG: histidine triad nucleotide-binding protein [bacterium]